MSPIRNLCQMLSRSLRPQFFQPRASPIPSIRQFTQTPLPRYPRKGFEDRNSINTQATEYSKSGTDDAAAEQEEAAFDPKKTNPEEEKKTAGRGSENPQINPLEVSPANPEVSKPTGETESRSENSGPGERKSGTGSPKKAGKL